MKERRKSQNRSLNVLCDVGCTDLSRRLIKTSLRKGTGTLSSAGSSALRASLETIGIARGLGKTVGKRYFTPDGEAECEGPGWVADWRRDEKPSRPDRNEGGE